MRAVTIQSFGAADGLAVSDVPEPAPGPGQVLIGVEAIGVGGVDVLIRGSIGVAYGIEKGHVLGSEVAGTVTATGDGVDPALSGRRVWAFTGLGGGYAERAVVPAAGVLPLPDGLSAADAVTVGTSARTAYFGLRHARFTAGQSVLVRGAAGGIGIMAVQLAVRMSASAVAVTTSSAGRGQRLRELGATHVLDRSGEGSGPAGYDVILDIVAGRDLPSFFARLNASGRLVAVGAVAGSPPADFGLRLFESFQRSLSFSTFSTDTVPEAEQRTAVAALLEATARGELRSVVHEVLPLEKAVLAHQKMDAGEVFGRIVLTPERLMGG
jgi:NADPH:quinone reductase